MRSTSCFSRVALLTGLALAGCTSDSGGGNAGGSAGNAGSGGMSGGGVSGGASIGGGSPVGSGGGSGSGAVAPSAGSTGGAAGGVGGTSRSIGAGGSAGTGGAVGGTSKLGGGPAGGSASGGGGGTTSSNTNSAPQPSTDKPSTDTTWNQGLKTGANGPIPWIVVDQFGYRTGSQKVAVIRSPQTGYDNDATFTPGSQYALVDKATGKAVKQGAPTAWNGGAVDPTSGDKIWWFDFSDVTTPGTYTVVDNDKNVRSVEFDIDDNVYRSVLKHAVRMFFYQRAGVEKSAKHAGAEWADAACLLGKGQDSQAHAWLAKTDESKVRDLRGGWFDAGDTNRYTAWASGS